MSRRFVVEHRVPWPDVDLARMVYFPRYFSYFEMAELEWIRSQGYSYESFLEALNIWMPRVSAQANYHAPARLADPLSIEMWVAEIGRRSYTFAHEVYRVPERTLIADGSITIVTVSREAFESVPVPQKLRDLLSSILEPPQTGGDEKIIE